MKRITRYHIGEQKYRKLVFLSLLVLLSSASSSVFAIIDDECESILVPSVFAEGANEKLELKYGDNRFFSQEFLELSTSGLYTFCCDSKQDCNASEFTKIRPREARNLYDHAFYVFDTFLGGSELVCKKSGISCIPHMYQTNTLPSPSVCFRNGADLENGGDSRCVDVYNIEKGVDTYFRSIEGVLPGLLQGLRSKFFASGIRVPIKREDLVSDTIKDLSFYQIAYYMCEELEYIYDNILDTSNFSSEISGGSVFAECLKDSTLSILQVNEFMKIGGGIANTRKIKYIEEKYSNSVFDSASGFLDKFTGLVSGAQEMLDNRSQKTKMCVT